MRSSEQIEFATFGQLNPRDKRLVLAWRDLGNDWATSLINSGVLSPSGWRCHPDEAARAQGSQDAEELALERYLRIVPTDDATRRRQAAEHEAAHAVVAQALGLRVRVAHVAADGSGECVHDPGTPAQTAAIALAGEVWINTFRSLEFPRGDAGCGSDRRTAAAAVDDRTLRQAAQQVMAILRDNKAHVLALADRIDSEGEVFL